MALEIKNLKVNVEGNEIVKGVSLSLSKGKVIALMGPNGSGKSTLASSLMGHPKYQITSGSIHLDAEDITAAKPHERAKKGLFLAFQYPAEIEGVSVTHFLRTAYMAKTGKKISVVDFYKLLKEKMQLLKMDEGFARRQVNFGFSGGEKKRLEILQLSILEPSYAILDETDSGLDIDALKTVSEGVNAYRSKMSVLLITHYTRILKYIMPDEVYIMKSGKIVKKGGAALAHELEEHGYELLKEDTHE